MRYATGLAVGAACIALVSVCWAQPLSDVPTNHWARQAVSEMVRLGVMRAPNGKFAGGQYVTRAELAQDLERFARALDAGKRVQNAAPPSGPPGKSADWASQPVTRYELAATLWRAASIAGPGLQQNGSKRYGASEALPPAPKVTLPASNPAYASVRYLASKRMVSQGSPLLSPPASARVNGRDVVGAVTEVLVGLVDQFTDEPQNRIELEEGGFRR